MVKYDPANHSRKRGRPKKWTEERARAALADKEWRMSHLYKIKTKDQKLVTMKPNAAQRLYASQATDRDIILKARQLGFSTYKLIEQLDYTITNPNTNSAVIAHLRDKVTILFEIIRLAFEHLPEQLKPRVAYDNRNEIYFPDLRSKIFVALDTRGETIHNLHVSELAFMENAEQKMLGILESVPKTGKISFESTANGMAGYFYDTYMEPNSEFKKHFYNWTLDPEYALETDKSMGELQTIYDEIAVKYNLIPDIAEKFNLTPDQFWWYIQKAIRQREEVVQEYPITDMEAFMSSGRNVFNILDIQKHEARDPVSRMYENLLVYEKPQKNMKYVVGVDPSEGIGGDNSVICVVNAYNGEQVAEFATNKVPPDVLAGYVIEIANYYNKAFVIVEVNSIGLAVMNVLKNKYMNLYRRESFDKQARIYRETLGWKTSAATKPVLIQELEQRVRDESILINSAELLKELKTYVRTEEPGKQGYGAEGSAKDDRVIAIGLCVQGMKALPRMKKPMNRAQQKMEEFKARRSKVVNHKYRPRQRIRGIRGRGHL